MSPTSSDHQIGRLQGNAGGPNTGGEASAVTVNQDREAYTLSAGFALGLINIGKGRWSSGVSNGSIAETLRRLIVGGAWGTLSSRACTHIMVLLKSLKRHKSRQRMQVMSGDVSHVRLQRDLTPCCSINRAANGAVASRSAVFQDAQ